jgi:hypothetical protein
MLRRQLIPFLVTLLAACLCGGSATRLHILAVLVAKPFLTIAIAALLLFVVQHSSDICRLLRPDSSGWVPWNLVPALLRHLVGRNLLSRTDPRLDIPESPCLQPRFQRPPPAVAR